MCDPSIRPVLLHVTLGGSFAIKVPYEWFLHQVSLYLQQQQQQRARRQLPGCEQLAEPGLMRRHGVQLLERGTGRRRLPGKRPLLLRRLQERLLLPR